MKRLLVMILLMFLLTGCSEKEVSRESNMFVYIQESDMFRSYDVVYHKDTKVMYVVSHGSYSQGIFTVLVNPDGTPMLYEESEDDNASSD